MYHLGFSPLPQIGSAEECSKSSRHLVPAILAKDRGLKPGAVNHSQVVTGSRANLALPSVGAAEPQSPSHTGCSLIFTPSGWDPVAAQSLLWLGKGCLVLFQPCFCFLNLCPSAPAQPLIFPAMADISNNLSLSALDPNISKFRHRLRRRTRVSEPGTSPRTRWPLALGCKLGQAELCPALDIEDQCHAGPQAASVSLEMPLHGFTL